jgi:type IV pilus assembly protein PilF
VTASDEPEAQRRARARMELASAYFGQNQMTTALDQVKLAIAADPNYGEAFNLRGLIYANLGDNAGGGELQAGAADQSARRRHDAQLRLLPLPAEALSRVERAVRAGARGAALRRRGPDPADAGRLPRLRRPARRGRDGADKAYELDPTSPFTATNLAEVLYRARRLRARAASTSAASIALPTVSNAQTLWLAARIEHKLGNWPGTHRVRPAAAQPLPRIAGGGGVRARRLR